MKKLRMTLATSMLLFLTAIVLQSCLDDWDDKYDTLFAVGTVKVIEGKDYYFSLDEGSKLYPSDTTYVHDYAVTDGQRAFIYFRELEEKLPGYEYNAQIKHIENILTKDIYSMPAEKADSIGDDNINATDLWITGEYLNIKYQFYHSNNEDKKHMLTWSSTKHPPARTTNRITSISNSATMPTMTASSHWAPDWPPSSWTI